MCSQFETDVLRTGVMSEATETDGIAVFDQGHAEVMLHPD
jgi:hypothetical protein